jgi:hypothetical protein
MNKLLVFFLLSMAAYFFIPACLFWSIDGDGTPTKFCKIHGDYHVYETFSTSNKKCCILGHSNSFNLSNCDEAICNPLFIRWNDTLIYVQAQGDSGKIKHYEVPAIGKNKYAYKQFFGYNDSNLPNFTDSMQIEIDTLRKACKCHKL